MKCFAVFLHQSTYKLTLNLVQLVLKSTYKLTLNLVQLVLNVPPVSVYCNSTLFTHYSICSNLLHVLVTNFTSIRQNFTQNGKLRCTPVFYKSPDISLRFFKTVTQLNIQWMVDDYILVKR